MASYRRIHIEISNICNLQCSFCPEVERDKKTMSPEDFAAIAEQLPGTVDEICLHLMGEPLLHPQLATILEICETFALPVNLTSNAILLHGARRALLLKPIIRQVNFSIHAFEANFGSEGVGPYFEKILRFIMEAEQLRPDLYINLRLWDLADPAAESAANRELRERLEAAFEKPIRSEDIDLRRKKNLQLRGRIYVHFDSRFVWPSLEQPLRSQTGFCHGLGNHFGIHADGTVVPCCLDKEAALALGNVFEEKLESILKGPRAEAMRSGFARGELVEDLCQRCDFVRRFDRKARRLAQGYRDTVSKAPRPEL